MAKIRVLVVDDSVVIRRLVSNWFADSPHIEAVGVAANGRIALDKISQISPDLVTLDVDMPELDGLETLKAIRKLHPRLPVVMFSTLTERGAVTTLEALSLGATDYVSKPANVGAATIATARVREQLIEKIIAVCQAMVDGQSKASASPAAARKPIAESDFHTAIRKPIGVLAVGVSTGGPNALARLIPALPADFPIPLVIVQHMPPVFTRLLAERLNSLAAIQVQEAVEGAALKPGVAWLAPGNCHMVVKGNRDAFRLGVNHDPAENSCRPSVDVLFRSVAKHYGPGTLAVVLTGMGQDGLRGCRSIRESGGQILAQDESSSVVWGMPGFVANAGLADKVIPLDQIAGEILHRVWAGRERIFAHGGERNKSVHFGR